MFNKNTNRNTLYENKSNIYNYGINNDSINNIYNNRNNSYSNNHNNNVNNNNKSKDNCNKPQI